MTNYTPTIGLEIHIELKTKTKMFCGCLNNTESAAPNKNVCPICLGHPGALPTINKEALKKVIKLGLALNGHIREISYFDRKSYFYPDLPKGYQISQYEHPLVEGGELNGVRIRRIHLEEDTGRLLHPQNSKSSLVDFNRAGVPLMEMVTEPDIKSGEEAAMFAKDLKQILHYLEISNADMEKGQMRVEANISLSRNEQLGTKVEIKNLNSFKAVEEAAGYEIKRQAEALSSGEKIVQETRGWDENEKTTKSQRTKEEAHDYRYIPEPNLPPLDLTDSNFINVENLKAEIPELPKSKKARFQSEYNLEDKQASVLVTDPKIAQYFEEAASELQTETDEKKYTLLANYLTSDLFSLIKEKGGTIDKIKITPENFADLVALVIKGDLTSRMAKDILAKMFYSGEDPRAIMEREGIKQISDGSSIKPAAEEVINKNKKAAEDYKKGKETALKFLVGKTMAELKGQGNPQTIERTLKELLTQ